MRRWVITAAVLLAIAAFAGGFAMVAGLIPINASSGHFAVTEAILVFAKKRSIATHTWGKESPPLDDPALVLKGAGHFEAGCRPCHGAPDLPRMPRVPRAMLPPPPNLAVMAREYEPEELFYIVKHGIKFTGMPPWPSQVRDDEVGAMVAFLVTLPDLDGPSYRRLVHGDPAQGGAPFESGAPGGSPKKGAGSVASLAAASSAAEPLDVLAGGEGAPKAVVASCGRCHGMDGLGRGNAAFPALAGQREQYLVASLEAYAADRRQSGVMQPSAASLPAEEMRQLARYYSRQPARRARGVSPSRDAAALSRGREISERGVPDRRLPSCSDCHGPGPGPRFTAAPQLAGQYADYLVLQLQLLAEKRRGGTDRVHLMDEVAPRMTEEQMHDVALYYESLAP